MFGPVVCPRDSRALFLRTLNRSRSISFGGSGGLPPPSPSPPSLPFDGDATPRVTDKKQPRSRGGSGESVGSVGNRGSGGDGELSAGGPDEDGGGGGSSTAVAALPEVAASWGRVPAEGELLLPGFSSEKPGFLGETSMFSSQKKVQTQQQGDGSSSDQPKRQQQLQSGSLFLADSTGRGTSGSRPEERDKHALDDGGVLSERGAGHVRRSGDSGGLTDGDGGVGTRRGGGFAAGAGEGEGGRSGEVGEGGGGSKGATAETKAPGATSWGGQQKEAGERRIRFMITHHTITSSTAHFGSPLSSRPALQVTATVGSSLPGATFCIF